MTALPVSAAVRPIVQRSPSERARSIVWSDVLSEELFRDALARERKRADRFEEPFVLVLVSLNGRAEGPSRWRPLLKGLSPKLDADVIGWFEQGSVLGFVRSLADRGPKQTATSIAAAVRRELARSLSPTTIGYCSIRLEMYSPHSNSISPALDDIRNERRANQTILRAAAKRFLDIVGSAACLLTLSPLFLLVSALVKLTSEGPIFFRQQRVGQGGRPFTMLKFRTMRINVDERIHQKYVESFIQSGKTATADKNVVFKIVDDPRVTPVGQFLRKSSLDELPQFWNALKGEMSLVGPRPSLAYEVARYKGWHRRRVLEVKPGITGLWQVTGRSRTTFDEMVRLDLRYARTHSMLTDLKILLATPWAVISGEGAH
jgi:lipopolysaccharide/colanic/teichoic acid biosynthesis glycosyltransferase